jgi:hypothetical protein
LARSTQGVQGKIAKKEEGGKEHGKKMNEGGKGTET